MPRDAFQRLLAEVRACQLCADALEHGARPVVQLAPTARILVAGQAPGRRVHETGVPFDDPSGDRLRAWMGVDAATFYDPNQIAILPMGFCYPGTGRSGDLPPRPECAPAWRKDLLAQLPDLHLILVIGQYAQRWHLGSKAQNVTDTVRNWRAWCTETPARLPLPHPSPRNNLWLKRNPWFTEEVLPYLRRRVRAALAQSS